MNVTDARPFVTGSSPTAGGLASAPASETDQDRSSEVTRLRTENSHLRELVDTQRGVIADLKAQQQAHRALRDNPHVSPLRKDTLEVVYELLGCPLGTSPATRTYPDTIISHEKIAQRLGVSAKQIGKHLADMETDGWVKRALATGTDPETGHPVKRYHYAPVEGQAFLASIGAPEGLVERHDPGTSTLKADADRVTQRRRLIEARCPVCKTTDCTIHCSNGHRTHMDDVAEATPAAPPAPRGRQATAEASDTSADPRREDSSLRDNTPGGREDTSDSYVLDDGLSTGGDRGRAGGTPSADVSAEASDTSADPRREDSSLRAQAAAAAAVATLAPVATRHRNAVTMRGIKGQKYVSLGRALTEADLVAHLRGTRTVGAGLLYETPEGARAQAVAWDEDGRFDRLVRAAARLNNAGLRPLLVRNPVDPGRGHLWLLFTAPCDPAWAIAAAERLAPELRDVGERFPDLSEKGGGRVRLPGGSYVLPDGTRRPVQVAAGTDEGPRAWLDGTTPEAWALISVALSDPAILGATFVPRAERPQRATDAPAVRLKAGLRQVRPVDARGAGDDPYARFNAAHPIESLVDVGRDHKFTAPWRAEDTASVHVYDDGHWHDFGPDGRHGRDAYDLWCALNGYWDAAANRPDRRAARRALEGG